MTHNNGETLTSTCFARSPRVIWNVHFLEPSHSDGNRIQCVSDHVLCYLYKPVIYQVSWRGNVQQQPGVTGERRGMNEPIGSWGWCVGVATLGMTTPFSIFIDIPALLDWYHYRVVGVCWGCLFNSKVFCDGDGDGGQTDAEMLYMPNQKLTYFHYEWTWRKQYASLICNFQVLKTAESF